MAYGDRPSASLRSTTLRGTLYVGDCHPDAAGRFPQFRRQPHPGCPRTFTSPKEDNMRSRNAFLTLTLALALALPYGVASAADPGVTATEIKIGNTMPYSGPASAYGTIGKASAAYFKKVNEEGGINGRKINFVTEDDGYSPP